MIMARQRRKVSMLRVLGVLVGLVAGTLGFAPWADGVTAVKVCGSGYGHGVGLAQYGAYGRAQAGQNYAKIVRAYYQGVNLHRYRDNPFVRVLLKKKGLDGSYDVVVASGSTAQMVNLATGGTVALKPGTYRVRYLSARKLYQLTDVSSGEQIGGYKGPIHFEPGSGAPLSYAGKGYRGKLRAEVSDSKFYLINRLRMEHYIRGVVPAEISSSWAPEALKSQAVAVRSYARATRGGDLLDFYADPRDQAYGGASSETAATNKAVANTAGVVAVYDGKPIRASYHSSDGGYTEDSSYVFGRPVAYLKAVRDVDPQGRPFEKLVNSPWTQWSGTLNPDGSAQLNIGSIIVCPGRRCGRRVSKLYGLGRYFQCRHCHSPPTPARTRTRWLASTARRGNPVARSGAGVTTLSLPSLRSPRGSTGRPSFA
jgi:stage II sporulation protein D